MLLQLPNPASVRNKSPEPVAPLSSTMLEMTQKDAAAPLPSPLGQGFAAANPPPPASVPTAPAGVTVRTEGKAAHASPT
jgi:hypothetical protein